MATLNPDKRDSTAEGITWISAQAMIALRHQARKLPLDRNKIRARQGGAYLSTYKGRGMEFDESRIYQPGDDIRNMDWRVTARTGDAHTKVFQEERERPVLLWLDLGNSMMFATRNCYKSVIAARCAATFAWSAASRNDRVGGLVFSGEQHTELKPGRGKSAVLRLIGQVASHPAWGDPGQSSVAATQHALARLRKVTHPGSLIFMISDFRNMSDKAFSHLANLSRHNDIVLIDISDPFEITLPDHGEIRVTDGMHERRLDTGSPAMRESYHQRAMTESATLFDFCRRHGIHVVPLSTADDIFARLQDTFGADHDRNQVHRASRRRGP